MPWPFRRLLQRVRTVFRKSCLFVLLLVHQIGLRRRISCKTKQLQVILINVQYDFVIERWQIPTSFHSSLVRVWVHIYMLSLTTEKFIHVCVILTHYHFQPQNVAPWGVVVEWRVYVSEGQTFDTLSTRNNLKWVIFTCYSSYLSLSIVWERWISTSIVWGLNSFVRLQGVLDAQRNVCSTQENVGISQSPLIMWPFGFTFAAPSSRQISKWCEVYTEPWT